MRNRNGIFWGLFLLLSAAILVASQLHLIAYNFGVWTIIATIMLVAVLLKSLVYFMIPGTVFSLAFLAILYAKPLRITALVPWTILGAALLISIGLSMILRPLLVKHHPWMKYKYYQGYRWQGNKSFNNMDSDVKTVDQSDVDVYVKMSSSIRYVKSENFKEANIDVSMGDAKVYFENVTVDSTATINLNVSLGGVELYVPKNWRIEKRIDNNMSGITEVGPTDVTADSPIVTIRGLVSLSGLKISYI